MVAKKQLQVGFKLRSIHVVEVAVKGLRIRKFTPVKLCLLKKFKSSECTQ